MKLCAFDGCGKPQQPTLVTLGLCSGHAGQWYTGKTLKPLRQRDVGDVSSRFWRKVDKECGPIHPVHGKCWIWTASLSNGYGHLRSAKGGCHQDAHRASWRINVGEIPGDLCVLHKCDNRACVRPDHLFLGTKADNTADMMTKRRCFVALTEDNIQTIRRMAAASAIPPVKLARLFGVSRSTVYRIRTGTTWGHV